MVQGGVLGGTKRKGAGRAGRVESGKCGQFGEGGERE